MATPSCVEVSPIPRSEFGSPDALQLMRDGSPVVLTGIDSLLGAGVTKWGHSYMDMVTFFWLLIVSTFQLFRQF